MTVDEAIEQLDVFATMYGGHYKLVLATSDDEEQIDIVDFKRLGSSDGLHLAILAEQEVVTKSYHCGEMNELREDHREELSNLRGSQIKELDELRKELVNAND